MNTLAHAPFPDSERAAWIAALEALKVAEAEVLRARRALNEALVAYIGPDASYKDLCTAFAAVV